MKNNNFKHEDFRGYNQSVVPKIDEVLARTNPKTPCGEYLRRYWHPVALTSEVSKIPREIRILGEDLVIFKTTKGNYGLVQPTIQKLFNTAQFQEIVLKWSGNSISYHDYLKGYWSSNILDGSSWNQALHDGFFTKTCEAVYLSNRGETWLRRNSFNNINNSGDMQRSRLPLGSRVQCFFINFCHF